MNIKQPYHCNVGILVCAAMLAGCGSRYPEPYVLPSHTPRPRTTPNPAGGQEVPAKAKHHQPPSAPQTYPTSARKVAVAFVEASRAGRLEERITYMTGKQRAEAQETLSRLKQTKQYEAVARQATNVWGSSPYTCLFYKDLRKQGIFYEAKLYSKKGTYVFILGLRRDRKGTWRIFDLAQTLLPTRDTEAQNPSPPKP